MTCIGLAVWRFDVSQFEAWMTWQEETADPKEQDESKGIEMEGDFEGSLQDMQADPDADQEQEEEKEERMDQVRVNHWRRSTSYMI